MATRPGAVTDIGDLLVREGLLTGPQLDMAVAHQRKTSKPLIRILVELNLVDENKRLNFFKRQFGVPILALEPDRIDPILYTYIPAGLARRHHLVPVKQDKDGLVVAMEDPSDLVVLDDLKEVVGMRIKPVVSSSEAILEALAGYPEDRPKEIEVDQSAEIDPGVRFMRFALMPILSIGVLAGIVLLILYNSSVQTWLQNMLGGTSINKGSQIFSLFLYFFLSWGVFTLVAYEVVGLVLDDFQWRDSFEVGPTKSKSKALLLSILLGWLGIDRFYMGYNRVGLLKLFTVGVLGLWWIMDIILIAGGKVPDAAGRALTSGPVAE